MYGLACSFPPCTASVNILFSAQSSRLISALDASAVCLAALNARTLAVVIDAKALDAKCRLQVQLDPPLHVTERLFPISLGIVQQIGGGVLEGEAPHRSRARLVFAFGPIPTAVLKSLKYSSARFTFNRTVRRSILSRYQSWLGRSPSGRGG